MRKLQLKTSVIDQTMRVRVRGDIDAGNAQSLHDQLTQAARSGPAAVIVDLAGVRKMDSAGVAVLVQVHELLGQAGRQMRLDNVPEAVHQMLELLCRSHMVNGAHSPARTRRVGPGMRLHDPTVKLAVGLPDGRAPLT